MKALEWRPIEELNEHLTNEAYCIHYWVQPKHYFAVFSPSFPPPRHAKRFCIIPEPVMPFVPEIGKYYMFSDEDKDKHFLSIFGGKAEDGFMDENGDTWVNCRPMTDAEKKLIG